MKRDGTIFCKAVFIPAIMEMGMRYFFDVHDGDALSVDETGVECASWEEMRRQAIAALPDLAADILPDGKHRLFWINVRDESGVSVVTASLTYLKRVLAGHSRLTDEPYAMLAGRSQRTNQPMATWKAQLVMPLSS